MHFSDLSPWDARAHNPALVGYALRIMDENPSLVTGDVLAMMERIMEKHRRDDG